MSSGFDLFQKAEMFYQLGKVDDTFDYYQRAIRKIIKDENVTASLPATMVRALDAAGERAHPREVLGVVWMNFVGFFKDPKMRKDKTTAPEAYKLLMTFSPKSTYEFRRFRTDKAKILLKGMQVSAGFTLGLLTWDTGDRVAALKHYRSGLDLAAEYPGYDRESKAEVGWEAYLAREVQEMKNNMAMLLKNDELNVLFSAALYGDTGDNKRKEVIKGVGYTRLEADGTVNYATKVQIASDKCGNCGKRDAKMSKCSGCKVATYCDPTCQKTHWPKHKAACKAART